MRSKPAKIILGALAGLTGASLLALIVIYVIKAFGGTGTNSHWPIPVFGALLAIFAILLVLVYLLTEPSFKKKPEDEEELYTVDRTSYVKKAKQPRPVANNAAAAPAAEEAKAEETKAE